MQNLEAFIFVSSPAAVTPFHLDPEQNFLLQIRGTKKLRVFDATPGAVISEGTLERFFSGAHRNLVYDERHEVHGETFTLCPGDALHVPVASPHWVRNGEELSVSLSVTFRTERSRRFGHAHAINAKLRAVGLVPQRVGSAAWRDRLKSAAFRALQKTGVDL